MTDPAHYLAPNHAALIDASCISPEVAASRGYRTVTVKAELLRLGFKEYQARVPALLIPICDVRGELSSYQIRPDEPRINKDGKPVKYESPGGSRLILDVPRGIRGNLADPSIPLLLTEGGRKADSAVSKKLTCISVSGVWCWRGRNEFGGNTALADWESIALNGRRVYLVFDSDVTEKPEVQKALFRLRIFLQSREASVAVIKLPSGAGGKKVGLDDFFGAGKTVDDLMALVSIPDGEWREDAANDDSSSAIYAGQADLQETVIRAWDAVKRFNVPPRLFLHGSFQLVRVSFIQDGQAALVPLTADSLRLLLSRSAKWFLTDRSGAPKDAKPPTDVARAMLVDDLCPLPVIDRIIRAPILDRDGNVVLEEGYHPGTRVYHVPGALTIPVVPLRPSPEEISEARELILDDLLGDFPFVSKADSANALALYLLPFVRELIDGSTPLHLIEKPAAGTGAGLLADMIATSTRGGNCPLMTEGREEEEWRKRITAALLGAPEVLMIDNLRRRLDSAALSAAITTRVWSDRKLGQSLLVAAPVRCAWIATGNNPAVSSEIARRSVSIRMDSKVDRPWNRPSELFKHPQLRMWAAENRGRLIAAALTLARAWIAAEKPEAGISLGGFEEWARVMGGILKVAGVEGFLDNRQRFYDRADREGEIWRSLVSAWWGRFAGSEIGTKDLFDLISEQEIPFELGRGSDRSQKTRLGVELAQSVDRRFVIGDICLCIQNAGEYQHAARWRLVNLVNDGDPSSHKEKDEKQGEGSDSRSEPTGQSPQRVTSPQGSPAEGGLQPDQFAPRLEDSPEGGRQGSQGPQRSPESGEDREVGQI